MKISDGRISCLLLLSKQIETECRDALGTDDDEEKRELITALRNIKSARCTLERIAGRRLLQTVAGS